MVDAVDHRVLGVGRKGGLDGRAEVRMSCARASSALASGPQIIDWAILHLRGVRTGSSQGEGLDCLLLNSRLVVEGGLPSKRASAICLL